MCQPRLYCNIFYRNFNLSCFKIFIDGFYASLFTTPVIVTTLSFRNDSTSVKTLSEESTHWVNPKWSLKSTNKRDPWSRYDEPTQVHDYFRRFLITRHNYECDKDA